MNIKAPFQELREFIKNHKNTTQLVTMARGNNPKVNVYLSIIDGDTVSSNGIYNSYLNINIEPPPIIMSTGYEFIIEKDGYYPFVQGSKMDRIIRVATAKHYPLGVYYPGPNFCILIQADKNSVEESFIDNFQKLKNKESAVLIRNFVGNYDPHPFV
ncbi:hypothetical protein ACTFIZ_006046 [Dictyostelium cf. discoideum]